MMKRILSLLLTVPLCLCAACGSPAISETETGKTNLTLDQTKETAEMKETLALTEENFATTEELPINPEYSEASVELAKEPTLYKTYGRTYLTEKGLSIDFGGNGFEFEVECGGDVFLQYNCAVYTYFQVFVDGVKGLRITTRNGENLSVKIAEKLPDGVHNIRIIRDTDATKAGELMAISAVTFTGKKESFKAPADKPLYIEFVGDSITAGKYTEMQYVEGDAIHKATNSYAYLTAEALNADFSILARGGCGYFRVSTCPRTMNQLYPYYNGFAKHPQEYVPARRADVVVLALGTNDGAKNVTESFEKGTVPFASFEEALTDQIRQIRNMHGDDVQIVLLYGMMSTSWEKEFKAASASENTYLIKVTENRSGGNHHPSREGHQVFAKELVRYLQENVLK